MACSRALQLAHTLPAVLPPHTRHDGRPNRVAGRVQRAQGSGLARSRWRERWRASRGSTMRGHTAGMWPPAPPPTNGDPGDCTPRRGEPPRVVTVRPPRRHSRHSFEPPAAGGRSFSTHGGSNSNIGPRIHSRAGTASRQPHTPNAALGASTPALGWPALSTKSTNLDAGLQAGSLTAPTLEQRWRPRR